MCVAQLLLEAGYIPLGDRRAFLEPSWQAGVTLLFQPRRLTERAAPAADSVHGL